jgi:hypothetical protein
VVVVGVDRIEKIFQDCQDLILKNLVILSKFCLGGEATIDSRESFWQ